MGGRTRLSGLLGAAAIAVVLLFLTEPMQYLPKAALGAVIVAAAIGLVDRRAWQGLARTSRVEVAIAAVTLAGVVAVGVLEALLVAVALSIVDVARRSAIPTTRSSAGSNAWAATPTSGSIRGPESPPGC
jgi:SulP family sulfate permease